MELFVEAKNGISHLINTQYGIEYDSTHLTYSCLNTTITLNFNDIKCMHCYKQTISSPDITQNNITFLLLSAIKADR